MNISSIGTNIADWFRGIPEKVKELQDRVKLYFAARKAARSPKINDQQNQASQVVTNQNTNAARSNEANFHETKNNTNTTDASPLASIDQWNAQVKNEKVNIQTQFSSTSTVGTAVKNFIDSQAFLKFDDNNDTVRKDFARGVLRGVLGGVHETALGADGISWEIGEHIQNLAMETELWKRCGGADTSSDAVNRYPALTRLKEAFKAVMPEFTAHMTSIERP